MRDRLKWVLQLEWIDASRQLTLHGLLHALLVLVHSPHFVETRFESHADYVLANLLSDPRAIDLAICRNQRITTYHVRKERQVEGLIGSLCVP